MRTSSASRRGATSQFFAINATDMIEGGVRRTPKSGCRALLNGFQIALWIDANLTIVVKGAKAGDLLVCKMPCEVCQYRPRVNGRMP